MFVPQGEFALIGAGVLLVMLLVAALIAHTGRSAFDMKHDWSPAAAAAIALLFVLCLIRIQGTDNSPFLYFQF